MDETYVYEPELPLDVPIAAYGEIEVKDVKRESLQAQQEQSTVMLSLLMFGGGHFFYNHHKQIYFKHADMS